MILSKKLLKYKSIKHCFLGMEGGKSKGIYKSLNCGRGSSDTKVNVIKNLKIACRKIGSTHKKLILLHQVHSCLLYTSPSPRDMRRSRMPSSA